jgi:hypothetical protein
MATKKLYHTQHAFNYKRDGQEDEFITGTYDAEDLEDIMDASDIEARIKDGHLREEEVPADDEPDAPARRPARKRKARKKGNR